MFSITNITHPTPVTVNAALDDSHAEESRSESRLSIRNLLSPELDEENHLVPCPEPTMEASEKQAEEELVSPLWSPSYFSSPNGVDTAISTDISSPDELQSSFTSPLASPSALSSSRHVTENPRSVSKRRRANSTQLTTLNAVFKHTFFPSTDLRERLGLELNMSPRSVQIWFQNKRQQWRQRRKLEEQMLHQQQSLMHHQSSLQHQQQFPQHAQLYFHPQAQPLPRSEFNPMTTGPSNVRIAAQRGEPAYSSIHHRLVPHPSTLPAFINPQPSGVIFAPVTTIAPFYEQMSQSSVHPPTYYYTRNDQNP